jgi:hypothetical protein
MTVLNLSLRVWTKVAPGSVGVHTNGVSRSRTSKEEIPEMADANGSLPFLMVVTAVVLFLAFAVRAQDPGGPQANNAQARNSIDTPPLEDIEQSLGPFSIAGQSFAIALHEKRLVGTPDPSLAESLAALELRDRKGAILYQTTFPVEVEEGKLKQTVSASARLLAGKNLTGLLISYNWGADAEAYGEAWQLFGFRDGKLELYDTEMGTNGPSITLMRAQNGAVTCVRIVPEGEVVEFRVWTGNFYLIVPVRVDWGHTKLMLGQQRCFRARTESGCDMRVEAERKPTETDVTFLRLFPGPEPNMGMVRHVVVERNSKVQILKASAIIHWSTSGDLMRLGFRDLWLKVLIDDDDEKEGWIQGAEDFAAVGLPTRRSEP